MPALDAGIFFCGVEEDERRKSAHDARCSRGETVSLWHGSGFSSGREWKKMASMTSLRPSDRVDSATIVKIFFRMAGPGDSGRSAISADGGAKNHSPSVHGGAAILPHLLKYSAESETFSVCGGIHRHPGRLPVVREVRAIPEMLTTYCRITQFGTKHPSTTITNTEDRYAQSLV